MPRRTERIKKWAAPIVRALPSSLGKGFYHQPASWLPVAGVGVAAALLFKATGRLTTAVVLHMVYNAVVIGLMMYQ